jgi:hypothetical protein
MIVSHKYHFLIAVPVGLNAGDWLTRIAAEGDPGYLEIVGLPNGVCVPEGCEDYNRYFVDDPYHRLPQLWEGRKGTPWEGPVQVQNDLEEWLKWYMFGMRRKYLEMGIHASPNGWGMRGEDGDWVYFEHPSILRRVFAGIGNSPKGVDAPWGRRPVRIIRMNEMSRGWRDMTQRVRIRNTAGKLSPEQQNTFDLLRWHIPAMYPFYELPDELVSAYMKENAREFANENDE